MYNDADDGQTHDKTSRFRNVATLLILAMWTLGDCVAPDRVVVRRRRRMRRRMILRSICISDVS